MSKSNEYLFKYGEEQIDIFVDGNERGSIRLNKGGKINRIDYRDFCSSDDNVFLHHFIEELGFREEHLRGHTIDIKVKFGENSFMPTWLSIVKDGTESVLEELDNGYVINSFIREVIVG